MKPSIEAMSEAVKAGNAVRGDINTLENYLKAKSFTVRISTDNNAKYIILQSTPALANLFRDGVKGDIMAKLAQCEAVGADVTDLRTKAEHLLSHSPV